MFSYILIAKIEMFFSEAWQTLRHFFSYNGLKVYVMNVWHRTSSQTVQENVDFFMFLEDKTESPQEIQLYEYGVPVSNLNVGYFFILHFSV